ncbi:MAG: 4-hydroxy-tetrahydrodipicolinate reductase, partial [Azonexus sp.]|nr:4-hydroxy-tetrahydrodipicolinate reductase [Azonexus sp.]
MSRTRIGITGASGRMGRMLIEATLNDQEMALGALFEQPGNPFLGKTAGDLTGLASDITVGDDLAAGLKNIDCLIDFTRPAGALAHLELCRQAGVGIVIGTTGFEAEGKAAIAAAAKEIPVVFASNMAVGVNL